MEQITKEFLQNILSQQEPNIQVVSFSVTNAVDKGENFMSLVYRVVVEVTLSQSNNIFKKHLVIKLQPNNPIRREQSNSQEAFRNEAIIYNVVLPEFENFAARKGYTNILQGFPASLQKPTSNSNNSEFIVLEDLGVLGFKMVSKREGVDFKHCELVMRELGEFHACSLAMKYENPEKFYNLRKGLYEVMFRPERESAFQVMIETFIDKAANVFCSHCPNSTAVDRITKLKDGFFLKICDFIKPQEPLSVITHGDCWTNNMLFSYDEDGNPTQVKLIDFQISRYGSLAQDLNYFFYISTTHQLRDKYLYDLLKIYYESLIKTLKTLAPAHEEITFSTVIQEFYRNRIYGLFMAFWLLPLMLAHEEEMPDLEEMTEEDVTTDQGIKKWDAAMSFDYEARIVGVLNECLSSSVI